MYYLWTYEAQANYKLTQDSNKNRAKAVVTTANDRQDQDVMIRLSGIGDDIV